MDGAISIEFELSVTALRDALRIRIGEFGERAVAWVECGAITSRGLGATAREALVASLAPLGPRATTAVLSAPAMFAASAQLLAARAAS